MLALLPGKVLEICVTVPLTGGRYDCFAEFDFSFVFSIERLITVRVRSTTEGYSFTLLVCSRGGGGVSGPASGGGGVRSSRWGGGSGPARGGSGPAAGGGGASGPAAGGEFRSSCWGGGSGPAGEGGGQVQLAGGGVRFSWGGGSVSGGGGVSILRPLAGGMPLAFTQEDFLVFLLISAWKFLPCKFSGSTSVSG